MQIRLKMKDKIQSEVLNKILSSYIFWFFFTSILFIALAIILPIKFEDNDDIVMLLFASGQYTGIPEFRLVFINSIFGYFLKTLYTLTNKIEWYSVIFSIIHIISTSLILWKLFKTKSTLIWKLLFAIIFITFQARLITQFQFTTTAAIVSLAGLILFSETIRRQWILGIVLFCIGTLIRFESAILVLIIYSPYYAKLLYKSYSYKILKKLLLLAIPVCCFFSINYISYQLDNEWKAYYEFNKIRGGINDNPNSASVTFESEKEKINHDLLLHSIADNKNSTIKQLKEVEAKYTSVKLQDKLSNIFPSLLKYSRIFLVLFLISTILFLNSNKDTKIYLLLINGIFITICILISLNGILKERVFYSSILPYVFLLSQCELKNYRVYAKYLIITILIYFVFFNAQRVYSISLRNRSFFTNCFLEQKKFIFEYSDNYKCIIMPYASSFNFQSINPLTISFELRNIDLFFLGWLTRIPYNNNKIVTHLDFINKNNKNSVIFITKENYKHITTLLQKNFTYNYNLYSEVNILKEDSKYILLNFKTK